MIMIVVHSLGEDAVRGGETMESRIYTAQEMSDVSQRMKESGFDGEIILTVKQSDGSYKEYHGDDIIEMLRQAAEMREMCEVLLEDIVKCKSHHTGICQAHTGEIISYWNCPKDKPCANAVIIKELRALLRGNARKEEK